MPSPPPKLKRRIERLQQSLPVELGKRFVEIDLLNHAASLSFFALLSLAPLLLLLLWLAASLYPEAQAELLDQIGDLAGTSAQDVAGTILRNASDRPDVGSLAGLWSTLLLFIGATTVFARLQATLNLIFHTSGGSLGGILVFLRKRVFSFGVVFALGFLVVVSTLLSAVIEFIFAGVPSLLPLLGTVISLLIYALAFALLYHYLPDRQVRWQQAFLGGIITAALFMLGRWAIGIYIARAAPGSAYGSMGTVVILLVWMYYAAMVFFVGALITAVIDERAQERLAERPPAGPMESPDIAPEPGQVHPRTLAVTLPPASPDPPPAGAAAPDAPPPPPPGRRDA